MSGASTARPTRPRGPQVLYASGDESTDSEDFDVLPAHVSSPGTLPGSVATELRVDATDSDVAKYVDDFNALKRKWHDMADADNDPRKRYAEDCKKRLSNAKAELADAEDLVIRLQAKVDAVNAKYDKACKALEDSLLRWKQQITTQTPTVVHAYEVSKTSYECCLCPITHHLMVDPVIASDGNTYERNALVEWLRHNQTSPVTRAPITAVLTPNRQLKSIIAAHAPLEIGGRNA